MRRFVSTLGIFLLLNSCTSQANYSQAANDAVNCPKPTTISLATPTANEGFYDHFDYHIRNIVADASTIKFQTSKNDFVYCRPK